MRPALAYLAFELRRRLPAVGVALVPIALLPLLHRLAEKNWNYWQGDWPLFGALLAVLVGGPLLGIYLAFTGWAGERENGTFQWIASRPLPAPVQFAARLLVIAIGIALFLAAALVFNRISLLEVVTDPWVTDGQRPILLLAAAFIAPAGAVFASALSRSPARAAGAWFLGGAALFGLMSLVPTLHPPLEAVLPLFTGTPLSRWTAGVVFGGLFVAFVGGAFRAVTRAPLDPRRLRRGWLAVAAVAVPACTAGAVLLLQPFRVDASTVYAVRSLGEGHQLRMVRAPGFGPGWSHPLFISPEGQQSSRGGIFVELGWSLADRRTGKTLILKLEEGPTLRWSILDRQGRVQSLDPSLRFGSQGDLIGWSPGGGRLAWLSPEAAGRGHLTIVSPDPRAVRVRLTTPKGQGDARARWIDDDHLLIYAVSSRRGEPRREGARTQGSASGSNQAFPTWRRLRWWQVVGDDGATASGPHFPEGEVEISLAMAGGGWLVPPLPPDVRLGGRPAFWLATEGQEGVARIEGPPWRLTTAAPAPDAEPLTLGSTEDESLVWIESSEGADRQVVRLREAGGTIEPVCRLDAETGRLAFWRSAGSWALWRVSGRQKEVGTSSLLACQLETGEVRRLELPEKTRADQSDFDGERVLTPQGDLELD